MKSPPWAVLLVAGVLASASLFLFSSRSAPKHAVPDAEPAPVPSAAAGAAAVTPAPDQPRNSDDASPLPSAAPSATLGAQKPSEDSLAAAMHALEDSSPERALELARQGQALWPTGPRAAEFAATEVKCLYRLGRASEGRGTAEAMVNKYPGSSWALEVERQTGAHPYVNH